MGKFSVGKVKPKMTAKEAASLLEAIPIGQMRKFARADSQLFIYRHSASTVSYNHGPGAMNYAMDIPSFANIMADASQDEWGQWVLQKE